MKLLIDTTNNYLILSLLKGDKIEDFKNELLKRDLTKNFHFIVDEFLKKNKTNLKELEELWVVAGPGSFTGIKIGVVFANTIKSLNKKITLRQIDSIQFLQSKTNQKIYIDARGDKIYFKKFIGYGITSSLKNNTTPYIVSEDNVLFNLKNFRRVRKIKPIYIKRGY